MNPPDLRLSVIIPVHGRPERLAECLRTLAACTCDFAAELIVIKDGGPEDFRSLVESWQGPLEPRYMEQENAGPARARNNAVRASRGEILLFLNDDILLEPEVLQAHEAAHRQRPGHAVMGNTRWARDAIDSEFMHWVAHHDHIHYEINDLSDIGWGKWHTLNASIDRRWFSEEDQWFSEEFPSPALEDTEFSFRLAARGLKVALAPQAIVWHHHRFQLRDYVAKSRMRGECARVFTRLHPEIEQDLLREYRDAVARHGKHLWWRDLLRLPDGPEQWHARFGLAYLAGFAGQEIPPAALRIR